jgi:hypothetical protein
VSRSADGTYHRLGLVELLIDSGTLKRLENLEKKEIIIGANGLGKKTTASPQYEAQIQVSPKNNSS